jgi:hypothetical protein
VIALIVSKKAILFCLVKTSPTRGVTNCLLVPKRLVIHFFDDFLGDRFFELPEMYKIKRLLNQSGRGLNISGKTNQRVVKLMHQIENNSGSSTIIYLLSILHELAESNEVQEISSEGFINSMNLKDSDRLKRVYEYIMNNFDEDLNLNKAAAVANMSPALLAGILKAGQGSHSPNLSLK